MRFQHAICNEAFEKWGFRETCRFVKATGYDGLEIAPFTLAESPEEISASRRRELAEILADEGLAFVGLHWLMVSPKGLHVTTPDEVLRKRSWEHIIRLIDLCADLGPKGVMVFGSPAQRGRVDGATREEATRNFVEGLRSVAPHAESRGVRVLVEALPSTQTDVILTLSEAVSIVQEINSPAIRTMFDTHNAIEEVEPHTALINRYFELIEHVHVNENDGGHCGTGDYDFRPVLETLARRNYAGWVSLEAFNFQPGPERIAEESLTYLNRIIETL